MTELFDAIAGSETGAIIASTLSIPESKGSKKGKYFAEKSTKFFEKH